MKNRRVRYFLLVCLIIILGLGSRGIPFVPLFVGDTLYSIMIFFIIQFIFIDIDIKKLFVLSLMICYVVEFSQLFQAEWLNSIRTTTLGKLVLGQGFLWSDIVAYTVGITITSLLKRIKLVKTDKERDKVT